ncbi:MAG TPA: class II aldolase/adducin family protein [bacterium]|jgi:L-fuculose-phosphate aldolase|nr:class II aldolase/adducin family protein [bacterium]
MEACRKELTIYGRKIIEKGLAAGPGGNISARDGDSVFLSPSGFFLDEIEEKEWVRVHLESGRIYGELRPTCEIAMHLGIYVERKDVNAVVHTHPPVTVGLISAGVRLKPFFPDYVALLGREIPVIEYVQPGSGEMRNKVVGELRSNNVVLLKNHGVVCAGETLREAFARSWLVEEAAKSIFAGCVAGKMRYLNLKEIEGLENMEAEDYRKALMKKKK